MIRCAVLRANSPATICWERFFPASVLGSETAKKIEKHPTKYK